MALGDGMKKLSLEPQKSSEHQNILWPLRWLESMKTELDLLFLGVCGVNARRRKSHVSQLAKLAQFSFSTIYEELKHPLGRGLFRR